MKYILVLISLVITVCLSAQIVDDNNISYSTQDNNLKTIFEELEAVYGIRFSYASESISDQSLTYSFSDESLENVLATILSEAGMEYKVIDNNVLVRTPLNSEVPEPETYRKSLHLRGKVTSAVFGDQGVDFAAVVIKGTPIGSYTDPQGRFDLEIPSIYLDSTLVVSYVGLDPMSYKISELTEEYLLVPLTEASNAIEEIMIVNRAKPITIKQNLSATVLQGSALKNMTSGLAGSDINRMIQFLPGVVAYNDTSAELLIRGGNSDETMVLLDAMPLYQTTQYYKVISAINPLYVESVTIYKNYYPPRFSGGTSGLIAISSGRSHPSKIEGQLAVDLLKAEGYITVPLGKKSSIHLATRSSLGTISNDRFNTEAVDPVKNLTVEEFGNPIQNSIANTNNQFNNINAKYQFVAGDKQYLSLNFYRSGDEINTDNDFSVEDTRKNRMNLTMADGSSKTTTATSLIYDRTLSAKWSLNTLAYAKRFDDSELTTIDITKELGPQQNDPGITNPNGVNLTTDQTNKISDMGAMVSLRKSTINRSLNLGLMGTRQSIIYNFRENKDFLFRDDETIIGLSTFASYTFKNTDKYNLNLGLRSTYYTNINKAYFSPRVSAFYNMNDKISIKSAFNVYQQVIRKLYYEYNGLPKQLWVTVDNREIPVLVSYNMMVGTTVRLGAFAIDTELFYKQQKGLIEYLALEPSNNNNNSDSSRDYRLFNGDGRSIGIDMVLSTSIQHYETYLTYTLSHNQERYEEIFDNAYFNSENDRRHQLTWVNSYLIKSIELSTNAIYASGRTYTDISTLDVGKDVRFVDPEERLSTLPPYFRIDAGATYHFSLFKKKSSIGLSVMNVLNNNNVSYIQSVSAEFVGNQAPVNIVLGSINPLLHRTLNAQLILRF